jgi:hypothetical protein
MSKTKFNSKNVNSNRKHVSVVVVVHFYNLDRNSNRSYNGSYDRNKAIPLAVVVVVVHFYNLDRTSNRSYSGSYDGIMLSWIRLRLMVNAERRMLVIMTTLNTKI